MNAEFALKNNAQDLKINSEGEDCWIDMENLFDISWEGEGGGREAGEKDGEKKEES